MKQISPKISALYEAHLNNKAIPKRDQFNYRKWLRYYLDFCFKNQDFSIKKEKLKGTGANWVPAYDNLKAEISLRHYSPKTLRSYRGWVRRFQDYTKSKDTSLLTSVDVKDQKDRTVPLPEKITPALKAHLESVMDLHQEDLKAGYSGVFLPDALATKYKTAATDLIWQWFFPGKTLTLVPEAKELRRYHLHESHVQRAIRSAVKKSRIPKRATVDRPAIYLPFPFRRCYPHHSGD